MRKLCNIRLVIFDLDGTLIDSAEDITLHVGRVYREFKDKDVPADEVKKNIGDGARSLLANFFEGQELEKTLEIFTILHFRARNTHQALRRSDGDLGEPKGKGNPFSCCYQQAPRHNSGGVKEVKNAPLF